MIEICGLHLHAEPESPSKRRGGTLPRSLEASTIGHGAGKGAGGMPGRLGVDGW
jgi:hypothetical protein